MKTLGFLNMNFKTKKAFITFELLLVLIISSIVLINSFTSIKDIYTLTKQQQNIAIEKIDLLSTKLFLQANIENVNKVSLKQKTLYFNNSILLENIESFALNKSTNYVEVTLKTSNNKEIVWVLSL